MQRCWLYSICLLVAGCARHPPPAKSAHPAPAEQPPRAEIPRDLRASVERAVALGREIYLQDKAGAIGTDVILEAVKTLKDKGMGGFLAIREGDESGQPLPAYIVLFYTKESKPMIR